MNNATGGLTCKICGVQITSFDEPGTSNPTLVHARAWDDYDHEPVPVPTAQATNAVHVCDFCGARGADWMYAIPAPLQTALLNGQVIRQVDSDGLWVACDGCDPLVRRGDLDGLAQRYLTSDTRIKADAHLLKNAGFAPDLGNDDVIDAQRRMWTAILDSNPRRVRIPVAVAPTPVRPAMMPRLVDRVIDFWRSDMGANGITADLSHSGSVNLPGFTVGRDDEFIVKLAEVDTDTVNRHIDHITVGLRAATSGGLYWISPQFTHLAVQAAKSLPDLTIERDELPSDHGFVMWQNPVSELNTAGTVANSMIAVPLVAASWTLIPQGVWITAYTTPEAFIGNVAVEDLRTALGWLVPISAGGGSAFGTHERPEGRLDFLAALVATWLLMRQPGVAQQSEEKVFADVRKKYKKAGRPEPSVKVVNIRRVERSSRPAGDGDEVTRVYTGSWAVGINTGGFWRTYWTGSGRSVRDRRWINPYIARADLPMKTEKTPKPTVKVLK